MLTHLNDDFALATAEATLLPLYEPYNVLHRTSFAHEASLEFAVVISVRDPDV